MQICSGGANAVAPSCLCVLVLLEVQATLTLEEGHMDSFLRSEQQCLVLSQVLRGTDDGHEHMCNGGIIDAPGMRAASISPYCDELS